MEFVGISSLKVAALAVQQQSIDIVERGLDKTFSSTAVEDYRDIISDLVLFYDALTRLGEDADAFLSHYANQHPNAKEDIDVFIGRTPDLKGLNVGGFKVVHDPDFRYEYSWR